MSKVIANMSMSLDGFIADPADGIDQLFGWMGNGDVEVPTAVDITHGWGGTHPVGVPVFVVTHEIGRAHV